MDINKTHDLIGTPCIGVCSTTSFGDEICRGCHRTFDEVRLWNTFTDEQKIVVNKRLLGIDEPLAET
jgi:uncharacterized protein